MKLRLFKDSMRWKLVLIYCLLVFIATTVIGVLIMSQLENYYMNSTKQNIIKTVKEGMSSSLSTYKSLSDGSVEIKENIDAWGKTIQGEFFVIDDGLEIIASNSAVLKSKNAVDALDSGIIYIALFNKKDAVSYSSIQNDAGVIPVMNVAIPIEHGKKSIGAIYIRQDLSSVEATIDKSKQIFLQAMGISLLITMALGVLIASSITVPINELTKTAKKMADGDFSTKLVVKSDDEIGKLAEMLNLLSTKLNATLLEMGNEKRKLETIIQNMADGLIAINLEGKIMHANQAACRLLHVPALDLAGESYDSVVESFGHEFMMESLLTKCKDGEFSEKFEKDNVIYSISYEKFKDENGNDIGIIILLKDITQRQKLENMQMDFVANVSHELKTPLTTIKGYTETLKEGYVDDEKMRQEFLSIIDSETDRMTRLVRDLLQLSRLDNDQEILNKREINLTDLVSMAAKNALFTVSEKNQQLNCLFEPTDRVLIFADKDRIEQVISNIISNACKYTKEGGRIDIDVLRRDGEAVVTVKDNGIGIPKANLQRVFERFFRVDKARSRKMGSTGLGLSISKQIVEGHSGKIEIESAENQGTVVTVKLPLSVRRGVSNIE
ncbi:MAG: ATP-binding protein [Eubacteriales bacterium]